MEETKGTITLNAALQKDMIDIMLRDNPDFICAFCHQNVRNLKDISGMIKEDGKMNLICHRSKCTDRAWNRAIKLEEKK